MNGFDGQSYYLQKRVRKAEVPATVAAEEAEQEENSKYTLTKTPVIYTFSPGKDTDGTPVMIYSSLVPDRPKFFFYAGTNKKDTWDLKKWVFPNEEPFPIQVLHYSL